MAEFTKLSNMNTWKLVDLPKDKVVVPLLWVFTYKDDADGIVGRFQGANMCRGDLQQDIRSEDVSALTAAYRHFRMLMALVAYFNLEVVQYDVVSAFPHVDIDDPEFYVALPPGFQQNWQVSSSPKALYGLRQARSCRQQDLQIAS